MFHFEESVDAAVKSYIKENSFLLVFEALYKTLLRIELYLLSCWNIIYKFMIYTCISIDKYTFQNWSVLYLTSASLIYLRIDILLLAIKSLLCKCPRLWPT